MRSAWFVVWVVMLIVQLLTFIIGRQWVSEIEPPDAAAELNLLELARQTNRAWENFFPQKIDTRATSEEEELLQRESCLIALQSTEQEFLKRGSDIRVAQDIKNWLAISPEGSTEVPLSHYIDSILSWMKPFRESDAHCKLERLAINPDVTSDFPSLVFEVTGQPINMGGRLLSIETDHSPWRLVEMEMYSSGIDNSWWMRGSYSYQSDEFN